MNSKNFSLTLQKWYDQNKRDLPWRNTTNPYKIWLSEIILQQTRVAQGLPYYKGFVDHFPNIEDLAAASEQEVLRLWQGLGYYSRARNLHACAIEISKKMKGKFPGNFNDLLKLKGVGTYTAAAIASFAFKEPVAVIDGNVNRVLSRIFGIAKDVNKQAGKKYYTAFANELLDKSAPDIHNQAIMEFGALQCVPVAPKCTECVFKPSCFAFKHEMQKDLPLKPKKIKIKERHFYYFILEYKEKIFMKRRVEKDIWQGLNDFYLIESNIFQELPTLQNDLIKKILFDNNLIEQPYVIQHKLTHQRIIAYFYHLKIYDELLVHEILNFANFALYNSDEILLLPKPIIIHKYLFEKYILLN